MTNSWKVGAKKKKKSLVTVSHKKKVLDKLSFGLPCTIRLGMCIKKIGSEFGSYKLNIYKS